MRYTKVDIKGVRTFYGEHSRICCIRYSGCSGQTIRDIAVVAFLIYKILPLIKTPSTTRIAKAVVAVLIIAWLTDFLHLYTVGFIMNQFLAIGLLALVILFQPELRRMLDHWGSVKLSEYLRRQQAHTAGDGRGHHPDRACLREAMGREKVGALIVFARSSGWRNTSKPAPRSTVRFPAADPEHFL